MLFRSKVVMVSAFFILFISALSVPASCSDYLQVQAAIDINTVASDGKYTLSQIADIARKNNISVIITSDGFLNKWEYGLWPLRNVIKRTMEIGSVARFGVKRYLDLIKDARAENPDMIFIGGVETGPFYHWEGWPFSKSFSIKEWHRHLLVVGLENEKDYKGLPVIGNSFALVNPFGIRGMLLILMLLSFLAAGLALIKKGAKIQPGLYVRWYGLSPRQCKYLGILLVAVSLIASVNSFPFLGMKYDQYHGDVGPMPYQNLIDYVNKRGGLTFWEHPEAKNIDKLGDICIETYEHADLLLATRSYTGFAIFYEGYDRVGAPGRIWDEILIDYCRGVRPSPAWAIGALDFEMSGDLGQCLTSLRTVILLSHFNKQDVIAALKEGRMYVSKEKDASNFVLDDFTVTDSAGGDAKIMGQELALRGRPHVTIAGHFANSSPDRLKIAVIRNGEIIKIMEADAPFKIEYEDDGDITDKKFYYRLEIRSKGLLLVTNPVFVSRK